MKRLLPLVSNETHQSVGHSLVESYGSDKKFMLVFTKHLKKVNPTVLQFIADWSEKIEGEEFSRLAIGMMLVYRLLESQAEAEQMDKDFGG